MKKNEEKKSASDDDERRGEKKIIRIRRGCYNKLYNNYDEEITWKIINIGQHYNNFMMNQHAMKLLNY